MSTTRRDDFKAALAEHAQEERDLAEAQARLEAAEAEQAAEREQFAADDAVEAPEELSKSEALCRAFERDPRGVLAKLANDKAAASEFLESLSSEELKRCYVADAQGLRGLVGKQTGNFATEMRLAQAMDALDHPVAKESPFGVGVDITDTNTNTRERYMAAEQARVDALPPFNLAGAIERAEATGGVLPRDILVRLEPEEFRLLKTNYAPLYKRSIEAF
ncbi:MAG TPA: hypothetical protein VHX66_00280 [Solirubrobacteraceae bacterium]|nr:hypothetical protein [Solirubrobacteraceae bacterium]